jgi:hypothetical protein
MATLEQHQTLGLQGFIESSDRQIGDRQSVVYGDDQHQRRRTYPGDVAAGLVLHQHLERAQCDLIAP